METKVGRVVRVVRVVMVVMVVVVVIIGNGAFGQQNTGKYAIAIHGGAGVILRENLSPELEKAYLTVLDSALTVGQQILAKGGVAMDAVESVIRIMEDCPLFNAGKGAVFSHDGYNELDASRYMFSVN